MMGLAMACGIGNFTDLAAWSAEAKRSHAMGATGAMCIHPSQVTALNEAFGASAEEIAEARAVVAAWEARTTGVVAHKGQMIDQPVVERARRLIAAAEQ
jgi:citrate lyase subunit beta/citryl-CoA lyase